MKILHTSLLAISLAIIATASFFAHRCSADIERRTMEHHVPSSSLVGDVTGSGTLGLTGDMSAFTSSAFSSNLTVGSGGTVITLHANGKVTVDSKLPQEDNVEQFFACLRRTGHKLFAEYEQAKKDHDEVKAALRDVLKEFRDPLGPELIVGSWYAPTNEAEKLRRQAKDLTARAEQLERQSAAIQRANRLVNPPSLSAFDRSSATISTTGR